MYAKELAANRTMYESIRAAHRAGIPIYAECGGLMYLTQEIVDLENVAHPMVGLLPGRSAMTGRLTLGYRTARAAGDSWLWHSGETVRGHEFHYSTWENRPADIAPAYELLPGTFQREARGDGAQIGNLFASYVHLHFLARPELVSRMISANQNIHTAKD